MKNESDFLGPDPRVRYSRNILLPEVGEAGQARLMKSRVLVIGAGGLGSPVVLYLAAAGVGTLGIVDDDRVELSNLQRQIAHAETNLGSLKVDSAARAIGALNSTIVVETFPTRLTAENATDVISQYDVVVDGTDNFVTRYLVNDVCALLNKPLVWGSVYRFEGQYSTFWQGPPGVPGRNLRDLYPAPPPPELSPSCAEGGVLGVVCGAIASAMVLEVVKLVLAVGRVSIGTLHSFDALASAWSKREFAIESKRPLGLEADYAEFCGLGPSGVPDIDLPALRVLIGSTPGEVALVDVREEFEWAEYHVPRFELMPKSRIELRDLHNLMDSSSVVLMCKSGVRSAQVARELIALGHRSVFSAAGGIDRWRLLYGSGANQTIDV